jgi:putative addiction module component (TIGR02574 family)
MNTQTIEREAMQLPLNERAALAERLLASLDNLPSAELEQLWLTEAVRRADEIDRGLIKLIPSQEVEREARALCR